MGEAAKVAGDGGKAPRDGGAGDARAVRRGRRAPRPAAQHTAAGRRVRARRASTVTSPLSGVHPSTQSRTNRRRVSRVVTCVLLQQAELTRSSFQPPPNKCVSDVPEWALGVGVGAGGAGEAGARRKKDGLLQKATRWWVRMGTGARPAAPPPPCVMVPRRPAPPDAWPATRPYHAYIPLPGRTGVPEYYRLGIYLFGSGGGRAECTASRPRSSRRLWVSRKLRLR